MSQRLAFALLLLAAVTAGPLQAEGESWKPLFNGRDLTGWKHVGRGEMDPVHYGYEVQIDNEPETSKEVAVRPLKKK